MGADYKHSKDPPLLGGHRANLDVAGLQQYFPCSGKELIGVSLATANLATEYAGIIFGMTSLLTVLPGAGASRTFTLLVNSLPTALTVTHGAADLIQFDDVNIVAVQRGDTICWSSDGGVAGPAASIVMISCLYRRI